MKSVKCHECKHLIAGISKHRNSRSNWYCRISRTECEPYRRIAQAKGDVIPIKTSPRWCPLITNRIIEGNRYEKSDNLW